MPDLRRLQWLASQMTPVEAAARVRLKLLERLAPLWRPRVPEALQTRPVFPAFRDRTALRAALERTGIAARVREEGERLLAGEFTLFGGLKVTSADGRPDWFLAWPSGPRWTSAPSFAIDISGRDGRDVRVTWELSRCEDLVTLARAAAATGDPRFAERAGALLADWVDNNPFLRGPNWMSALEVALRGIAWAFVEDAAPDALSDSATRRRFTDTLYLHALYVERYLSRGLNPSNHVIGEAAALFVLGGKFRATPDGRRWRARAVRILEEEAARQTYPSGASREHAAGYHRFVTALFGLCLAVDGARTLSARFRTRVASMYGCLDAMARPDGSFPHFGDSDEAVALRLSQPVPDDLSADLALGAALFPGMGLGVKPIVDNASTCRQPRLFAELDDDAPRKLPEALWLLGPSLALAPSLRQKPLSLWERGRGEGSVLTCLPVPPLVADPPQADSRGDAAHVSSPPQAAPQSLPPASGLQPPASCAPRRSRAFADAGLFTLRSPSRLLQIEFDAGPQGYSPVSGHGHADALSVTLWRGGRRLVDAGTYRYNGAPAWRSAFRSTPFHNALSVDGRSQAEPAAAFRWKTLANAGPGEWLLSDELDYASGTLARGEDRPWSQRREVVRSRDDVVFVIDTVVCPGRRRAEAFWHFGDAMLAADEDRVRAVYADADVMTVASLDGASFRTLAPTDGEDASPTPAWRSPHYGVREASASAVAEKGFDDRATLAWALTFGAAEVRPLPLDFGSGTAVEVTSGSLRRVFVVLPERAVVHVAGLVYAGRWGLFEFEGPRMLGAWGFDAWILEYQGVRLHTDINARGVARIV